MKAIIELAGNADHHRAALDVARRVDAGEAVGETDYRLGFSSARALFAHLTPARIELLESLRRQGECSVYALAKAAARNYSNVHGDVAALEEFGLVERNEAGEVYVPFDAIEIRLDLVQAA